jgi:hypothetical protein
MATCKRIESVAWRIRPVSAGWTPRADASRVFVLQYGGKRRADQ